MTLKKVTLPGGNLVIILNILSRCEIRRAYISTNTRAMIYRKTFLTWWFIGIKFFLGGFRQYTTTNAADCNKYFRSK